MEEQVKVILLFYSLTFVIFYNINVHFNAAFTFTLLSKCKYLTMWQYLLHRKSLSLFGHEKNSEQSNPNSVKCLWDSVLRC